MEKVMEYQWAAVLVIMVVEYLIGVSKLKSNSAIEIAVNVVKMIFGVKDEPKKLD